MRAALYQPVQQAPCALWHRLTAGVNHRLQTGATHPRDTRNHRLQTGATRPRNTHHRRAIILATVLVLISMMALMMAGFMFFVRAETSGTVAHVDGQQARLAAESGLEELKALLRESNLRHNSRVWFDSPQYFRHALVYSSAFDRSDDPVREARSRPEALEGEGVKVAWRYSIVAPAFDSVEDSYRHGITPESGKLNINHATDEQIDQLLTPLLLDLQVENIPQLLAALHDWMDADDDVREEGAEAEYYATLEPPYQPKNGPLDTIDELLLIKGFNAAILWGEDTNRNGLLDTNEDDGEESFPPYDNGDGILNYGIAPFLTVWSSEADIALDGKLRINLNNNAATVTALIAEDVEEGTLSDETIAFLTSIAGGDAVKNAKSVIDLYVGADEEGVAGALANSPIAVEELPVIADRFSVRQLDQATEPIPGLININTAPQRVLMLIPGMTIEIADALIAGRPGGDDFAHQTLAWPLTDEIIDAATYKQIAPYMTTKAFQLHVEIIGYGDHTKLSRRYEWIIEMIGPVAQIRYHRDLTRLGIAWPVDRELIEVITGP